jgi:excisionase family DNA binding protein
MFFAERAIQHPRRGRYRRKFGEVSMTTKSTNSDPLVVKPREACRLLACGRTHLYGLLAAKELDAFLDGSARKITVESIHRYIARQLATAGAP